MTSVPTSRGAATLGRRAAEVADAERGLLARDRRRGAASTTTRSRRRRPRRCPSPRPPPPAPRRRGRRAARAPPPPPAGGARRARAHQPVERAACTASWPSGCEPTASAARHAATCTRAPRSRQRDERRHALLRHHSAARLERQTATSARPPPPPRAAAGRAGAPALARSTSGRERAGAIATSSSARRSDRRRRRSARRSASSRGCARTRPHHRRTRHRCNFLSVLLVAQRFDRKSTAFLFGRPNLRSSSWWSRRPARALSAQNCAWMARAARHAARRASTPRARRTRSTEPRRAATAARSRPPGEVQAGQYAAARLVREAIAARRASRGCDGRVSISELAERNRAEQGLRIEERAAARCRPRRTASTWRGDAGGGGRRDGRRLRGRRQRRGERGGGERDGGVHDRVGCTTSSDDFVGSDSEAPSRRLASSSSSVAPDVLRTRRRGAAASARPAESTRAAPPAARPPAPARRQLAAPAPVPMRASVGAVPRPTRRYVQTMRPARRRRRRRATPARAGDGEDDPARRRALRGGRSSRFRNKVNSRVTPGVTISPEFILLQLRYVAYRENISCGIEGTW